MTTPSADIDTTRLESYLATEIDTAVVETTVLSDGLNLVLTVTTADGGVEYVVRQAKELRDTDVFNDLRDEYALLCELEDTPIPTQRPVLFCDDESVLGDEFFVTTYVPGEPFPRGSFLPERYQVPEAREHIATGLVDTLAEIHSLPVAQYEPHCSRWSPLKQVERATARLDATTDVTGREMPTLRAVGDWLRENAPTESVTSLVHGDYRAGNVLFAGDQPEITAVLDWEAALVGDPLTELGYLLLDFRRDDDPRPSLDEIEAKYPEDALTGVRELHRDGLSPFGSKPGSPTRRELVDRYEDRTGLTFDHEQFYRAHAAFLLASVWADLGRQEVEAGGESSYAPIVDYMALVADSITSGEFPL
ncbi:phosphotransferase family protein [Haloarchaeobius sp. DFWS5]|uniref:phosphotransferase family protein n=1 Tax=Haloarchaeobius sp. DFWS5 TaxID=3446114 RepID=UPI003EB7822F